jgi:putative nucleotidyltransferase with HDIG domain
LNKIWDMLSARVRSSRSSRFYALIIEITVFVLLVLIVLSGITPERYNLAVGDIAPLDIKAPKEAINEVATAKLQEQAAQAVPKKYMQDPTITWKTLNSIQHVFDIVSQAPPEERLSEIKNSIELNLQESTYSTLNEISAEELEELKVQTLSIVQDIMESGVKEESIAQSEALISNGFMTSTMPKPLRAAGEDIALRSLVPNMVLDKSATEKSQWDAINSVTPVRISRGEVIVEKGHKISEEQYQVLKSLGLVARDPKTNIVIAAGSVLLTLTLAILLMLYIKIFSPNILKKRRYITLLGLVILTVLLIGQGLKQVSGYLMPLPAGSVVVAILIHPRVAVALTTVLGILGGIILGGDFGLAVTNIVGGLAGIYSVARLSQRSDLTRSGLFISLANVCAIFGLGLVDGVELIEVLQQGLWGIINGVFSGVLAIGVLPYLENAFNITSPIKLLELSNPNQPLLKKLMLEAPGTYHHSIIVGNLAEAAAEAVGGEPLLVRVGAYYHDIGKVRRPYFFIENQLTSENPHDKIAPSLSNLIITSHIKDGVEIAQKHKVPEVVIDFIRQHHGTTLLSYFYHKALENEKNENTNIKESVFRYEGPKPQTREAAILMLADSSEAAVRSLSNPTPGRIEGMVRKIIKDRLNDGQFDECNITLKDLDTIAKAFSKVLSGIFHNRIEYPQNLKEIERGKVQNDGTNKSNGVKLRDTGTDANSN